MAHLLEGIFVGSCGSAIILGIHAVALGRGSITSKFDEAAVAALELPQSGEAVGVVARMVPRHGVLPGIAPPCRRTHPTGCTSPA